jgi:hypothetical protein
MIFHLFQVYCMKLKYHKLVHAMFRSFDLTFCGSKFDG